MTAAFLVIGKVFLSQANVFIGSILFGTGTTLGVFLTLKILKIDIVHKVVVGKTDITSNV